MNAGTTVINAEKFGIVMVDDEPAVMDAVEKALNGCDLFTFRRCQSAIEFAKCDLQDVPLCIFDMYFQNESRSHDLIELAQKKWSSPAPIIMLTNYPERIVWSEHSQIVDAIPKPTFLLQKPVLRSAVVQAFRMLPRHSSSQLEKAIAWLQNRDLEDAARLRTEIGFGGLMYPLRRATEVVYRAREFSLRGLEAFVTGEGDTMAEAGKVFLRKLHEVYQKLVQKPPSLFSAEDARLWKALKSVIDTTKYDERRTVADPNQIGKLIEVAPNGERIVRWRDGEESRVRLEDLPELATLEKGQEFEAVLVRQYLTKKLQKIVYVGRPKEASGRCIAHTAEYGGQIVECNEDRAIIQFKIDGDEEQREFDRDQLRVVDDLIRVGQPVVARTELEFILPKERATDAEKEEARRQLREMEQKWSQIGDVQIPTIPRVDYEA